MANENENKTKGFKVPEHKSKADENPNIEVNREGQDVNVNGDNSRQEPISAERKEIQDGVQAGKARTGIKDTNPVTTRQATVDESKVQNDVKDLPRGTPAFVKEHYEEVGDAAVVLFLSLLNLNNRKTIDKDVIAAYNDWPNKEDLEDQYNVLKGSTVL